MHAGTKRAFAIVAALFAVITVAGLAIAEEEKVSLEQLPDAVKATILRAAAGAAITEIERETKDGKTVFEAEFKQNGQEIEIQVGEDGTILGREIEEDDDELTVDQIPPAARAALLKLAGGAKLVDVERDTDDGVTIFEAGWSENGTSHEASVTEDGAVVETEEVIPIGSAPAAVQAAIAKHFGTKTKVVVEKKMIVVYEAEASIDGKESELLIFPTGQIHKEHGDDGGDNGDDEDHDD